MNNEVCRDFSTQVLEGDEVIVENTKISSQAKNIFFLKQITYVSKDQKAEEQYMMFSFKIINLITIGRLDYKSEGLLF